MRTRVRFKEWFAANEMTARRSFDHTMEKYRPPDVKKPVAILTAWRGRDQLLDPGGRPYPEPVWRHLNDVANQKLTENLKRRGLSYYPVIGAGQEFAHGRWSVNREKSFVVQPIGPMPDDEFENHIRELLFNPTHEPGAGPFQHTQDAAAVKLCRNQQAFLLAHPDGQPPVDPQSYTIERDLGNSADRRTPQDDYFTQMLYGRRADPSMMDQHDKPDDIGNPPPGKPGVGLPGQRFAIKDKTP